MGPHDAEVKYGITFSPYRGQRIFPRVLVTLVNYLKQKGINRVYGFVHKENTSSMRGMERAGFKAIGKFRLIKVMGIQVTKRYIPEEI